MFGREEGDAIEYPDNGNIFILCTSCSRSRAVVG